MYPFALFTLMEETFNLTTEPTNLITRPLTEPPSKHRCERNVKNMMAESNRNRDDYREDNAATKITPIKTI